jgi:hypothetical protein
VNLSMLRWGYTLIVGSNRNLFPRRMEHPHRSLYRTKRNQGAFLSLFLVSSSFCDLSSLAGHRRSRTRHLLQVSGGIAGAGNGLLCDRQLVGVEGAFSCVVTLLSPLSEADHIWYRSSGTRSLIFSPPRGAEGGEPLDCSPLPSPPRSNLRGQSAQPLSLSFSLLRPPFEHKMATYEEQECAVCAKRTTLRCSKCSSSYFCSTRCQKLVSFCPSARS